LIAWAYGPLDAVAKLFALRSEVNEGRNGLRTLFAHAISTEALYRILPAEVGKSGIEVWTGQASIFVGLGESPQASCRPRRRLP